MIKKIADEFVIFLLAVQFLTRLPVPSGIAFSPKRLSATPRYYPSVGLIIGALSAGVFFVATIILPNGVSMLLAIAAGMVLTGAFHEDGLADTFDGVGGGTTKERALGIMKDSRIGVYGTAALVMVVLIKLAALTAMAPQIAIIGLVAAHCLSRYSSILVIATSQYVREDGTGKHTAPGISVSGLAVATVTAIICFAGIGYWLSPGAALWCLIGLCVGHLLMRLIFEKKLGGYTGDTLGAVQQSSEVGLYLGLLAWA